MKSSFHPIADQNSRILILGSLPGDESIRRQEYYANPRNAFWKIISSVFEIRLPDGYGARLEFLKSKRIALWDVLREAERKGSLDSQIKKSVANDFDNFFLEHSSIEFVFFNGKKAQNAFNDLIHGKQTLRDGITYKYLPSTSPANSTMTYEEKLNHWMEILIM